MYAGKWTKEKKGGAVEEFPKRNMRRKKEGGDGMVKMATFPIYVYVCACVSVNQTPSDASMPSLAPSDS